MKKFLTSITLLLLTLAPKITEAIGFADHETRHYYNAFTDVIYSNGIGCSICIWGPAGIAEYISMPKHWWFPYSLSVYKETWEIVNTSNSHTIATGNNGIEEALAVWQKQGWKVPTMVRFDEVHQYFSLKIDDGDLLLMFILLSVVWIPAAAILAFVTAWAWKAVEKTTKTHYMVRLLIALPAYIALIYLGLYALGTTKTMQIWLFAAIVLSVYTTYRWKQVRKTKMNYVVRFLISFVVYMLLINLTAQILLIIS